MVKDNKQLNQEDIYSQLIELKDETNWVNTVLEVQ